LGKTVRLNDTRYVLEFHPLSRNIGGALGGVVGAALATKWNTQPDGRSEKQKREQFLALITQIQQGG
jgi:hypothetical protein